MHDDYLWDHSGLADPDVAALERTLAPLRYEAEPLRLPRARPRARAVRSGWWTWALPVGAAAAAAAMVLVLRGDATSDPVSVPTEPRGSLVEQAEPVAAPVAAAPVAPRQVETPGEPTAASPTRRAKPEAPARKPRKRKTTQTQVADAAPRVDCILDPAACEPLPNTLSSAEVRKGVAPIKAEALACAKGRDVPEGTRVKVKMTIRGATGRVSAATAIPPWSGTSLGECVAEAVSKARFPRFKKNQLGVMYPFALSSSGESSTAGETGKPVPASAVIREEMGTIRTKARACGVAHDVESGTRVELSLKISPSGAVKSVTVVDPKKLPADAQRCLKTAIGKIEFPRSDEGVHGRIAIML